MGDVDYARCLSHASRQVFRLDPEALYSRGGLEYLERHVREFVDRHEIDVVVYGLGLEFDFRPTFFREKLGHTFTVLLVGDDEHYFDVSHRYYAQCFDLVLTTNPLCERYRIYGTDALFLPVPYDATVFNPGSRPTKDIDVSFVGGLSGKMGRAEYAAALQDARLDFQSFGAGTPGGYVTQSRSIDIYRRSRINLNFSGSSLITPLDRDLSINRGVRQMKGRCYMLALCGSFILSEYVPGMEKAFNIGSELDVFHDREELIKKIRFYIGAAELREAMAAKAHARAVEEYAEDRVGKKVMLAIEERARAKDSSKQLALYFDPPFWSAFGAWRFKYLVVFLMSAHVGLLVSELLLLMRVGRFRPYAALWFLRYGLHAVRRTSPSAAKLVGLLQRLRTTQKGR